jgi:Ca2+-binding RTX toxin-like protein
MPVTTTDLGSLSPGWSVSAVGAQGADVSYTGAGDSAVITLTPRLEDGAPKIYQFTDQVDGVNSGDGFGLAFNMALKLDNGSGVTYGDVVVDLLLPPDPSNAPPGSHPAYSHFHVSQLQPTDAFTETGYKVDYRGDGVAVNPALTDRTTFDAGNRTVLGGNPVAPGAVTTWDGGRVHNYEDTFFMIVTPLEQADFASSSGVDLRRETFTFKSEHFNPAVEGTFANDFLYGSDVYANEMRGYAGNDIAVGTGMADKIWGGDGVDRLFGGEGDDELFGEEGADWLEGGLGKDEIDGGNADDVMRGNAGDDVIAGGDGLDTAGFSGAYADYTIRTVGSQTTVTHLAGGVDGSDTLAGVEYLRFSDMTVVTPVDTTPFVPEPNPPSAAPAGYNPVTGTNGSNTLNGTALADDIQGRAGADKIYGRDGDDFIFGGSGRDTIHGGKGYDVIRGNGDADTIRGGDGSDIVYGDPGADRIYGDNDQDELWGGAGNDRIWGGEGDDMMMGELGDDKLDGGAGFDIFVYRPGDGTDTIVNFDADDRIVFKGIAAADATVVNGPEGTTFTFAAGSVSVSGSGATGLVEGTDYYFA